MTNGTFPAKFFITDTNKKDTNSMSASVIEPEDTTVSTSLSDTTDITKFSKEDLLSVVASLRQENKTLLKNRDRVGLTFKRIPEDGNDSITCLNDGQFPFLTKNDSLSVTKDVVTDGNISLIEGENLAVLASLQMTHKGKIDVIYIDPPYNTGNDDFIYEDKRMYSSTTSELENVEKTLDGKTRTVGKDDPYRHSKWLSFMERRLFLARELLSETGVIFVSIDDNEQARLKLLMDEVFGNGNFIGDFIWKSKSGGGNDSTSLVSEHEYILSYANNILNVGKFHYINAELLSGYTHSDEYENTRGKYKLEALYRSSLSFSQSLVYPIEAPDGSFIMPNASNPESNRHIWRWSQSTFAKKKAEGRVEFKKTKNGWRVFSKQYMNENDDGTTRTQTIRSMITDIPGRNGSEEITSLMGHRSFTNPKPLKLIKRIISASSSPNSIILDFFAGSGTTGHAVAELNKEDGGSRSAILVTNNEGGISQNVTRERLARVLTGENWADGKTHEELPGNLSYYTLNFQPLPSNPLTVAQMMESRFDGLLSLENNTLNVVENDPDEDYAIYRNSDKVIFIWKNLFSIYDGECEEILESLKNTIPANEYIAYIPSESGTITITSEGWKVMSFPDEYISRYDATISSMRRNQTLPNFSK